jgi:hypothetical protein
MKYEDAEAQNLNGAIVDKATIEAFRRGYAGYDSLCYNAFRKLTRSAWSEADSPNLNLKL